MKNDLKLVTYFTKEEIEKIYAYLVEFAIRNYEKNIELYDGWKIEEYHYAKTLQDKELDASFEEIESFLLERLEKYNQNLEDNKQVINTFYQVPIILLKNNLEKDATIEEILNYIFDFVTNYVTYSEEYYKYSSKIPPKKNFDFDFKEETPVNKDVEGILVQGQGVCDEIANLICYLGKCFDVHIEKEFCTCNGNLHAINYTVVGTNVTYIDATRKIRGQKGKNECFLVSKEDLNKDHDYEFRKNTPSTTIDNSKFPTTYNMDEIINQIKSHLPKTTYQEYEKNKNSTK